MNRESVNECQASNSPPDTGGVAAPSRKRREATEAAQTGWSGLPEVLRNAFLRRGSIFDHPVRSVKGGFATSS